MKSKNILFLLFSDLIVFLMILGLVIAFVDLSNPVRLATFILMLITILIPGVMPFIFSGFGSPSSILTFALFVSNLIATIILFSIPIYDPKPLIITEVIIFGLYLAFMFVAIGESKYDKSEDEKKSIQN